jgi:hypothetical protein
MRFRAAALLPLVVAVLAGCGGGDTTVIQTVATTTTTQSTATTSGGETFVMDVMSRQSAQPSEFQFSVNGDLIARNLSWGGWGSPTATGTGSFDFNPAPHDKTTTVPGTVTVSSPQRCNGDTYYTSVQFKFEQTPPFEPVATPLSTPCS